MFFGAPFLLPNEVLTRVPHAVPSKREGSGGKFPGLVPQQGPLKMLLMLDNLNQDSSWALGRE